MEYGNSDLLNRQIGRTLIKQIKFIPGGGDGSRPLHGFQQCGFARTHGKVVTMWNSYADVCCWLHSNAPVSITVANSNAKWRHRTLGCDPQRAAETDHDARPGVGGVEEARHFDGGARFDNEDLRKLSAS